ncbi:MAG: DNA helicase RecQ [Gammaproteobacteria bacterium]|nr:DNA helicase RecQ [Gammaproteobacteria bacterium]
MNTAHELLKSVFGYDQFRHDQQAIIQQIVDGNDALVLMPTGGGKSLCYQIPALVRDGTAIIVSPLIALMQDQVDALLQLGIKAAFLNSSLTVSETQAVQTKLLNNELDLLYIAPERLLSYAMLALLEQCQLALFAIDEAHCVSQWGHDFRPEYQKLSVLHQRFPNVPRLALTATADRRTRDEIVTQLELQQAQHFISSFDRPNIHYAISEGNNPKQRLWSFLQANHPHDAGIVYCLSRNKVDEIAHWLTEQGRIALPYHAGLGQQTRQQHQQQFLREDGVIMVATIAFGMGIDKPDVRFVAHLNLPKSVEAYYQETGRAGRDGMPANAWMAYGLQDVITLRQFTQNSNADQIHKQVEHHKLESMLGLCELISCRRQTLLSYFDEHVTQPCGNCDNCLSPPQQWDGTEAAQKALSCIFRTGQQFGVNYLIDVLQGKTDQRIIRNGHDQITTFGIGKELSVTHWRSVFRQLIALAYIDIDMSRHGALCLTEKCRPLLRGEQAIALRTPVTPESSKSAKQRSGKVAVKPQDMALWEALRSLRKTLADETDVPAYVIFSDDSLHDMLKKRPTTLADFAKVSGVGQLKQTRYGQYFIDQIKRYPQSELLNNRLSDTVNQTLMLYQQQLSIEDIAQQRDVKTTTIYTHLAHAIEVGLLDVREVIDIDDSVYAEVVFLIESMEDDSKGRLKPIYDELDGQLDYGILKCIQAAL